MSQIQIDFSSLSPALQTAFSYLAEGNWRNANDCFDLALKASPLDPYACLGKAMTAACLKTPEELSLCTGEILEDPFFSAALKYAEGDLKNDLTQLVVRLNYDRQKAQAQRAAIETAAAPVQPVAEPLPGAETADFSAVTNWNAAAQTEGEAVPAAAEEQKTDGEEIVDVVKGKQKKKGRKKLIAALVILLVVLLGGGAAATYFYLIPLMKYNKAIDMINNKQFDEGLAVFEELGDFSDSQEQYKIGLYVKGLNYLANNDFENSKVIFEELGDFKDSQELLDSLDIRRVTLEIRTIAEAAEGDIVTFGKYETDGSEDNGKEDIRWLVLRNRDDLVTLISEQSIAAMRYHFNAGETSWAESSLRTWLNSTFFTAAFDMTEADFVCKNYITTPSNPDFPSPTGEAAVDKVYLLSLDEALSYFRTANARKLTCTNASYVNTFTDDNDNCCWWLRTSGARLESAVGVDPSGQIMTVGYDCYKNDQIGVRPVIVIDISGVSESGSSSQQEKETEAETTTSPFDVLFSGSETTTAGRPGESTTAGRPGETTTASAAGSPSTTKPSYEAESTTVVQNTTTPSP